MNSGISRFRKTFTSDGLYASGVDSVMPVPAGGEFTPDGLYDSCGDSVTPETGKFTANYFSYNMALSTSACWTTGLSLAPRGGVKPHICKVQVCGAVVPAQDLRACRRKSHYCLRQTLPLRGRVVPTSLTSPTGMKRGVDIRKDVCANVVLSSGTTIFQTVGEHMTWILPHPRRVSR